MLNKLPQLKYTLTPNCIGSTVTTVDYINSYIKDNHCEELIIDISKYNIMDSCEITTLCSTTHFIKYPNGNLTWKVSSKIIQEINSALDLGNTNYII